MMQKRANYTKALIVEGGAMRGVFSAGVLDGFLEAGFNPFDLLIGVSSGAANIAAYLAEMPERNLKIFTDYSLRKEFISFGRFLSGGHLMDLDWLWDVTIADVRLDLRTIFSKDKLFLIGLTDVQSGRPCYRQPEADTLEEVLKASSAMPVVYRSFPSIDGRLTADGGIADPIPIRKAIDMGARQIMVIRSRPRAYVKKEKLANRFLLWQLRSHPALSRAVAGRIARYNTAVSLLRNPASDIDIVEVCPPDDFSPARFGRNKRVLMKGYEQGLAMAREALRRWSGNSA